MLRGRVWLLVAVSLLTVYVVYVVWSKLARTLGPPPVKLGDVGEFLLFAGAVLALTLQVVTEEGRKSVNDEDRSPGGEANG